MISKRIGATPAASGTSIYMKRDWRTAILMNDENAISAGKKSSKPEKVLVKAGESGVEPGAGQRHMVSSIRLRNR